MKTKKRDTQALNKFLIMMKSRSNELQAQCSRILGMSLDTNDTLLDYHLQLGRASSINSSLGEFIDQARQELDKLGGANG